MHPQEKRGIIRGCIGEILYSLFFAKIDLAYHMLYNMIERNADRGS